jgi:8-amino-7-oxononanoate synthase
VPNRCERPSQSRGAAVPVLGPVTGGVAGDRACDALRAKLWQLTDRVIASLRSLGIETPNRSGLPIIEIPLRDHRRIDAVGRFLFENGVYVTLAAYPLVPKDEVGFRVQLTAANTTAEVDSLIAALEELAAVGELRLRDDDLEHAA